MMFGYGPGFERPNLYVFSRIEKPNSFGLVETTGPEPSLDCLALAHGLQRRTYVGVRG